MKEPSYRGGALYTSGVLSFSPEESKSLTDSNLGAIIGRFEATIFPKLDITVSNPSVEAEKTSVYQPQPQAKPNAPKFRM